jgi:uncharacterized protein YceH (UPF0502 family)
VDTLNEIEIRVLGSLMEKEITTPEYYPLSLNALVNACNQKSNREPAMNLEEDSVREALHSLSEKMLARSAATEGRVAKYEHRLQEEFNFSRHEAAVMCELFLRGPQTPGELRSRASRMQPFDDLGQVQTTLQRLMKREPPLVKVLPRQPGTKEVRYTQLLSPEAEPQPAPAVADTESVATTNDDRIVKLESQISALEKEIADLRQQFAIFRKQFE